MIHAPQGLILDAGGVLVQGASAEPRRRWEEQHGKPTGFLDAAVSEAIGPGWAGGRSEDEIRASLLTLTSVPRSGYDELMVALSAHETLDREVVAILQGLRPLVRTAILTNAGPGRRADLVDRFGVDELVDLIVVSAEEGISKPHVAIYDRTAVRLGLSPTECVFVDDDPTNVDGAVRAGMIGLHFAETERLRTELSRLGIGAEV